MRAICRDFAMASTPETSNNATARASAAATWTLVRAQAAATARRDVIDRRGARFHGLAVLRTLLIDDASGNLLGQRLGLALVEQALLDVHVLAFALGAPGFLRHDGSFLVSGGCSETLKVVLEGAGLGADQALALLARALPMDAGGFLDHRGAFQGRAAKCNGPVEP